MKLEDLEKGRNYHTSKLSQVGRQLSFVGIAFIWLFADIDGADNIKLNEQWVGVLKCFVWVIVADLLHLLYQASCWSVIHYDQVHRLKKKADNEIGEWKLLVNINWILYALKVLLLIFAYYRLVTVLVFESGLLTDTP